MLRKSWVRLLSLLAASGLAAGKVRFELYYAPT